MPRAIWNGSISFGLVNIPVQLFPATEAKDVRFNQIEQSSGQRVHYRRVVDGSDDEVPLEDIAKGYETERGRYVLLTSEEIESVEPAKSRAIEIEDFVDLSEVDPVYFERTYLLGPSGKATGDKPYALLRSAMETSGRVAIGRFVLRSKEHLVAIRPANGVLMLETLFFADEIREPEEIIGPIPSDDVLAARERAIAGQLIDSLSAPFDPDKYRDTHRERLLELIDRKANGEVTVADAPAPVADNVVDLMAALEASLATAGKRKDADHGGSPRDPDREASPADDDGAAADYGSLTRDELYEEAQRQSIAGRSRMTREELLQALRKAS